MVSAGQATEGHSAVFFIEGSQVAREMRASEFGAFLDGYVGLSDLAGTEVKAVLVGLSGDLLVRSLVFFRIGFDEEGRADSHWNLPIEEWAAQGAKGPDMGGGAIRLVCRSQCPDPGYASELWDPGMAPDNNHFLAIRKAVEANTLRFRYAEPDNQEDIPVLLAGQGGTPSAENTRAQRNRIAQVIRSQRLRIKTLQSKYRDKLSELQREQRLEIKALRHQVADLEQNHEHQRLDNEELTQQLSQCNQQCQSLEEQRLSSDQERDRDEANVSAELVLLREQLDRKHLELESCDEERAGLEQKVYELEHREPPENSIMSRLLDQSVFLVAYHSGVGHLTLPYDDIEAYFKSPTAYAAERSGMSKSSYLQWLEHYTTPVCQHRIETQAPCREPVLRVSKPGDFRPGVDDRCEYHND